MNELQEKIPIGISACLMGESVRYDAGHLRNKLCMDMLQDFCEWLPTCPEVAIGMPIPRPTIHLVEKNKKIHLLDSKTHEVDHTKAMLDFSKQRMNALSHLCGYVVAKNSPSCGMTRLKIWDDNKEKRAKQKNWDVLRRDGVGLFTQTLMDTYPLLPVEEEGRLHDSSLRDNFLVRIYIYFHWKKTVSTEMSYHKLYRFHAKVKYALMAADVNEYKVLGRYIADASKKQLLIDDVADHYISRLMPALSKVAKRKSHHNTLLHIMGYFKESLSKLEKQDLRQSIDEYYDGQIPLGVPVHLLRLYLARYPNDYLSQQFYLFPYPEKLATRQFL